MCIPLSSQDSQSFFVPSIIFSGITAMNLSKLFKVIQQRDFIKAMPESERRGFDTVIVVLDTMATEMCELVSGFRVVTP